MTRDALKGLMFVVLVIGLALAYVRRDPGASLEYVVNFEDAGSLKSGDAIYLKGVEIGDVREVDIQEDLKVKVVVRIREKFRHLIQDQLRHVIVHDKFLFGKKAMLLTPVGPPGKPIQPGQVIAGVESYPDLLLEQGADKAGGALRDAKRWGHDMLDSFRRRVTGREN